MLKQQHQLMVALLAAADTCAVTVACFGAWGARLVRFEEPLPAEPGEWIRGSLVAIAVPLALGTMLLTRLYRPRRDRSLVGELGQVVRASLITVVAIIVGLWAVGSDRLVPGGAAAGPSASARLAEGPLRGQLLALAIALPIVVGTQRMAFRLVLRRARGRGWNLRHVAVVGVGRLGQITARTLARNSWTGIKVAYHISHHPASNRVRCHGLPVQRGLDELEQTLERSPVDAVYIAIPSAQAAVVPELLRRLERFAVDVRIVPDVHPRLIPQSMQVHELEGMPILSYRESPVRGVGGVTKRLLDLTGATVGLVVFGPLMLAMACIVKTTDPGPVFFRQRRVSLGGDTFWIYKFRTMQVGLPEARSAEWTLPGDPRVTAIGRFLRRTSLDELPQLINVLRGDMSLVGPRPERPELIARFRDDWRGYMLRQHVKAGMTGWAQVNGLRGNTSLKKRLQYDLFYIRHWSVWFDVRILAMTPFRGFWHANAY